MTLYFYSALHRVFFDNTLYSAGPMAATERSKLYIHLYNYIYYNETKLRNCPNVHQYIQ